MEIIGALTFILVFVSLLGIGYGILCLDEKMDKRRGRR